MPVPVLVGSWTGLDGLTLVVPPTVRELVEAFWPGALTLVVEHAPSLAWDLGDTRGTVAVRMPLHPVALELLARTGPLGVSSANRTGAAAAGDRRGGAGPARLPGRGLPGRRPVRGPGAVDHRRRHRRGPAGARARRRPARPSCARSSRTLVAPAGHRADRSSRRNLGRWATPHTCSASAPRTSAGRRPRSCCSGPACAARLGEPRPEQVVVLSAGTWATPHRPVEPGTAAALRRAGVSPAELAAADVDPADPGGGRGGRPGPRLHRGARPRRSGATSWPPGTAPSPSASWSG